MNSKNKLKEDLKASLAIDSDYKLMMDARAAVPQENGGFEISWRIPETLGKDHQEYGRA